MATVYLAQDLRHERRVAVKVLRPELAAAIGAERFLAEIKTTASLQHSHILPLFDSGQAAGFLFYVMPLVSGESLRELLTREDQLSIPDALRIASEVASALDYAHRHGVVHRDVKPENILLHEGQVLVADFGVALALNAAGGGRLTETGISLGTPQYMSPEQASGERQITARSDIYALGCVLYEMLAGEPPFRAHNAQAVVAKVLTEKPERLVTRRETVPPHVEAAVLKALAKLPADRFASMREFQNALQGNNGALTTATLNEIDVARNRRQPRQRVLRGVRHPAVPWVLVALLAAMLGLQAIAPAPPKEDPGQAAQFAIQFPSSLDLGLGLAVSPDGKVVVAEAGQGLYARRRDVLATVPIAGSEGGGNPFISPDGRWVGFLTGQKLMKVSIDGGTPIPLADAFAGNGTWGDDGTIIYKPANSSFSGGLWRVPAAGGTPVLLTTPDTSKGEQGHYWPHMLPGSQAVLFTSLTTSERSRIDALSLADGKRKTVIQDGSYSRYVSGGHLLFVRAGVLLSVPFDPVRLEVKGEPIALLDDVAVGGDARQAGYAVSDEGMLAYLPGSAWRNRQLVWVDRVGREELVLDSLGDYHVPRVSPDGKRIALAIGYPEPDIWIYEIERRALGRLTRRQEGSATAPVWTADGSRVIYSGQAPAYDLFWRRVDGSAAEEKLLGSGQNKWATSVSPDGKAVAFSTNDLWILRLGERPKAEELTHTPFVEGALAWSPDGRWLAYNSNESGRWETYVGPVSNPIGDRRQVSTGGGVYARWGAGAREIFYFTNYTDGRMMSAPFDPATGGVGTPNQLFQGAYEPGIYAAPGYDVTRDGRRFLMVKSASEAGPREVRVVLNWLDGLRAREPR